MSTRRATILSTALLVGCLAAAVSRAGDEAASALGQLAERYYAAQAGRDLAAALALWDPQAPELPARRTALSRT